MNYEENKGRVYWMNRNASFSFIVCLVLPVFLVHICMSFSFSNNYKSSLSNSDPVTIRRPSFLDLFYSRMAMVALAQDPGSATDVCKELISALLVWVVVGSTSTRRLSPVKHN